MKKSIFKFLLVSLYLLPIVSYAIEMSEIGVGDTLYFDGFMNNPKVTVLDKDYSDNTIKIKKSDGSIEWVKSSKLMGSTGKLFDDMLQNVGKELGKEFVKGVMNNAGKSGERGFSICNETGSTFQAILGMNSKDEGVITHGHFSVGSGECNKLISGGLSYRYYYVHLAKEGSNILDRKDSDRLLCIDPINAFEIPYAEGRCADGQKNVYFRVVDTGDTSRAFKYTIN